MKILVAEDSLTVRRLVCARPQADGYEVIEADGEEALALALSEKPAALCRGGSARPPATIVTPINVSSSGVTFCRASGTQPRRALTDG